MKFVLSLILFACLSLTMKAQLVIDQFQSPASQNDLGGYWYTFNDNHDGGRSRLSNPDWKSTAILDTGGVKSGGMLSAAVRLEKANYQWQPYYAFATTVNQSDRVNPKKFEGISYWHKGVGHTFRLETPEVNDYDFYQIAIPESKEWVLVTVEFSMLNQAGWGKKVDLNLDNSIKLVWSLDKSSGMFQISNIQFEKEIKYEKQNDMIIRPAEIPVALEVKGNVNTPLNSLAQQYLTKGMNFASWAEAKKVTSANPKDWKYNESTVIQQANQGILGIRLPIDFDLYLKDKENVLSGKNKKVEFEPLLFAILDSMNVWTKENNLSFTIDYHAYDGTYNRKASKDPVFKAALASLWKEVAVHFKKEKREDLFFELTNEPGLSLAPGEFIDQEDWKSLAQMMIDEIRSIDKKRPIIFGDTKWYSLDELVNNTPFSDPYVIYCFHMYDPFVFTHQGASWSDMGTMKNVPFPYSEEKWSTEYRDFGVTNGTPEWVKSQMKNYYKEGNKAHIKNRLAKVKNWAFDHNVPLICNEWGALPNTAKLEDLNAYFKTMGEIFQEMDIAWQVWFGIMDNENNLLPGMAEALDLTPRK